MELIEISFSAHAGKAYCGRASVPGLHYYEK
jgi:hypothetical protein